MPARDNAHRKRGAPPPRSRDPINMQNQPHFLWVNGDWGLNGQTRGSQSEMPRGVIANKNMAQSLPNAFIS
ncbi:unnamed protein product, partial [Iphiclides podalirius]